LVKAEHLLGHGLALLADVHVYRGPGNVAAVVVQQPNGLAVGSAHQLGDAAELKSRKGGPVGRAVVRVNVVGVPGDDHIRLPIRYHPGNGQRLLPSTGEPAVGKAEKAILGSDHLRNLPSVSLPNAAHFLRRGIAKLAGQLAPGEPQEHGRISPPHVLRQGTGYPDFVVWMGENSE